MGKIIDISFDPMESQDVPAVSKVGTFMEFSDLTKFGHLFEDMKPTPKPVRLWGSRSCLRVAQAACSGVLRGPGLSPHTTGVEGVNPPQIEGHPPVQRQVPNARAPPPPAASNHPNRRAPPIFRSPSCYPERKLRSPQAQTWANKGQSLFRHRVFGKYLPKDNTDPRQTVGKD